MICCRSMWQTVSASVSASVARSQPFVVERLPPPSPPEPLPVAELPTRLGSPISWKKQKQKQKQTNKQTNTTKNQKTYDWFVDVCGCLFIYCKLHQKEVKQTNENKQKQTSKPNKPNKLTTNKQNGQKQIRKLIFDLLVCCLFVANFTKEVKQYPIVNKRTNKKRATNWPEVNKQTNTI